MQRVKTTNAATALPEKTDTGTAGYFQGGNTSTGEKATFMSPDWCNTVQEELVTLATMSGEALDTSNNGQAAAAVKSLIADLAEEITTALKKKADLDSPEFTGTPEVPTAAAGTSTKQAASTEFVAKALSATLTGTVTAYAGQTVASGWLECNGQSVSTTTYAALYTAIGTTFGSGTDTFCVPDLRGYFVRGWDHGRGIDSDRTFGTTQADAFASHTHTVGKGGTGGGDYAQNGPATSGSITSGTTGGTETRPKNIALMYIIKT